MKRPSHTAAVTCLSLAAGGMHGCAFGSPQAAWLQFSGMTLLALILFRIRSERRWALAFAVIAGFWLTSNAVGLRWIAAAITAPAELGPALGSVAYGMLTLGLGGVTVLALWLAVRVSVAVRNDALCSALLASAIMLGDALRECVLPSFPWLCEGYAHLDSPFAPFLPYLGVEGLSWVLLFAALLAGSVGAAEISRAATRGSRASALACTVLLAVSLAAAAHQAPLLTQEASTLRVAALQTVIRSREKFKASLLARHLVQIGEFAAAHDAQLIITPETAVPTTLGALTTAQAQYLTGTVTTTKALLFGAFAEDSRGDVFNSAVLLQAAAGPAPHVERTLYVKQHLAPFGEYAPPGFKWIADLLAVPMSNLRATEDPPHNFQIFGVTIIPSVCQDLLYGDDLRTTAEGPRLLVNLSNVEFFDDPLARGQFLNVARARALEQQVPVVIAANVGPTAMIDARGVVRRALPSATDGALEVTVRTRRGTTPYARHGQLWLRVLLALSALSSAAAAWRRRAGGAAPELMKPSRRAGPSAPGLLEK